MTKNPHDGALELSQIVIWAPQYSAGWGFCFSRNAFLHELNRWGFSGQHFLNEHIVKCFLYTSSDYCSWTEKKFTGTLHTWTSESCKTELVFIKLCCSLSQEALSVKAAPSSLPSTRRVYYIRVNVLHSPSQIQLSFPVSTVSPVWEHVFSGSRRINRALLFLKD